jgi:hypothetical protein
MADPRRHEVFVTGSGPVWVPQARLLEISEVISERHDFDAERAVQIATQMRRVV